MKYTTEEKFDVNSLEIRAFKVNNDANGNPRWVVHFLDLLTKEEQGKISSGVQELRKKAPNQWFSCTEHMFNAALLKARRIGGKKYRAKWFGGGIVFQSYNLKYDLGLM